jgi:hypothetical protein
VLGILVVGGDHDVDLRERAQRPTSLPGAEGLPVAAVCKEDLQREVAHHDEGVEREHEVQRVVKQLRGE